MGIRNLKRTGATVAALAAFALQGCYGVRVTLHAPPSPPYREVTRLKIAHDDLDLVGLKRGALASKRYFDVASKPNAVYSLGNDHYTFAQIAKSTEAFYRIVSETPAPAVHRKLAQECTAYSPRHGNHENRFTAYYEPVLRARSEPDEFYKYPVYAQPDDLTLVRLMNYFPEDERKIFGYKRGRELMPYLTRAEIDGRGLLRDQGLEIAWVDDPVALYFLHIQGSGRLRMMDDGRVLRVNFAASNGKPYTSIGRYMIDSGLLGPGEGSAGSMRAFLHNNPQTREEIFFRNERYIFFREVELDTEDGPIGSIGVPLVAGRSLATDPRYVPPGAVVYVETEKPLVDESGRLLGFEPFGRFMFNHDSGAAIKGPARADIYWGEGEASGLAAGYMSRPGRMTILMCGVKPSHGVMASTRNRGGAYSRVSWPGSNQPATKVAQQKHRRY